MCSNHIKCHPFQYHYMHPLKSYSAKFGALVQKITMKTIRTLTNAAYVVMQLWNLTNMLEYISGFVTMQLWNPLTSYLDKHITQQV